MESSIKEILESYKTQQTQNKLALKERKVALYEAYPKLAEIDKQMSHIGSEISKAILKNPLQTKYMLEELHQTLDFLKKEKALILLNNKIPVDALELQYKCTACQDTGYIEDKSRCRCFNQKLIDMAYEMSNIKKQLEKQNFEHFNLSVFSDEPSPRETRSQRENMKWVLNEAEKFVSNFPSNQNMIFYGASGLGKTFVCNCIAKSLIDQGFSVIYQTPFTIIQLIEKKTFTDKANPLVQIAYDQLFKADLLIMDDLGTETANTFTISEFYNIINTRILNEKSTLISTNIKLSEIATVYNDRIDSRIKGHYQFIKFYGPDVRWEY